MGSDKITQIRYECSGHLSKAELPYTYDPRSYIQAGENNITKQMSGCLPLSIPRVPARSPSNIYSHLFILAIINPQRRDQVTTHRCYCTILSLFPFVLPLNTSVKTSCTVLPVFTDHLLALNSCATSVPCSEMMEIWVLRTRQPTSICEILPALTFHL